jgi:hypothetical protein
MVHRRADRSACPCSSVGGDASGGTGCDDGSHCLAVAVNSLVYRSLYRLQGASVVYEHAASVQWRGSSNRPSTRQNAFVLPISAVHRFTRALETHTCRKGQLDEPTRQAQMQMIGVWSVQYRRRKEQLDADKLAVVISRGLHHLGSCD